MLIDAGQLIDCFIALRFDAARHFTDTLSLTG
jgi:hypothetical protein